MHQSGFKPRLVQRLEIKIYDRGKAERQIGARNLRLIGGPKPRMGLNGVVIERRRVAHVHVRINQPWDQKFSRAINSPRMRTGGKILADSGDLAVANNNIRVKERGGTLRRDQLNVFDYGAVICDAA